jgi:hypothetical protein
VGKFASNLVDAQPPTGHYVMEEAPDHHIEHSSILHGVNDPSREGQPTTPNPK